MAKKKPERHRHTRPSPTVSGDEVLALVRHCGGYDQAARMLGEKGIVNPSSGRPYSKCSVKRFCMQAKGWEDYQEFLKSEYKNFGSKIASLVEELGSDKVKAEKGS